MKKSISFILAFVMIIMFMPISASAKTNIQQKKQDAVVKEVMKLITKNMNDFEKVWVLSEWMRSNVKYNLKAPGTDKYSAYGALVNKEAVCQGFSEAFTFLWLTFTAAKRTLLFRKYTHA